MFLKTLAEATETVSALTQINSLDEGRKKKKRKSSHIHPQTLLFQHFHSPPSFLPSFYPASFPSALVPRPWACSFFIGISSQSAVLIVHLCRSEGRRAQYGASNYLCPLWCSRATERLTDPCRVGGGVCMWDRLLWRRG